MLMEEGGTIRRLGPPTAARLSYIVKRADVDCPLGMLPDITTLKELQTGALPPTFIVVEDTVMNLGRCNPFPRIAL